MTKYFTVSDIFLDVNINENDEVFVIRLSPETLLDDEIYYDRIRYQGIRDNFIMVKGEALTYWLTGNFVDRFIERSAKREWAKKFAIWYHNNRHKMTVIDLNS